MTDAPERIWLQHDPDGAADGEFPPPCNWEHVTWCGSAQFDTDVPYIRADLVPQWQPIETAPMDGKIDIWAIDNGGKGRRVTDCYYDRICDEWRTTAPALRLHAVNARYVTHWMPLPEPPK